MNDNLAQLIQNERVGQPDSALDFDSHENTETVVEPEATEVIEQTLVVESNESTEIDVVMLYEWIESNINQLEKIRLPRIRLAGLKENEQLFCTVKDPKCEVDEHGQDVRAMALINQANIFPVLDLPGYDMDIFGNGFQIMYAFGEDIVIKCYGIKTGLHVLFCLNVNDQLIPYNRIKLKKKDTSIIIPTPNRPYITGNISTQLDLEGLQINYKQVQKELDQITDKQSAITWILDKQANVRDINHLLQIDDILTWLISY